MNALDLFAGACGGWTLGLHRAGIETVAACEIDPWRRAVYSRNFPTVQLYGDVRELTAARLASDGIGAIDLVAGSPPCPDFSTANAQGRGIDGERGKLFFEFVRLVRELRPRWVCAENVPGIRARGYDRIHAELEAAGYAVRPLVVGAWHAGAPHRRKRVWIVADAAQTADGDASSRSCERQSKRPARSGLDGRASFQAHGARLAIKRGEPRDDGAQQPAIERAIAERLGRIAQDWNGGIAGRGRMDDGLPKGLARPALASYGDAVVPQITEMIGRAILALDTAPIVLDEAGRPGV